MMIDILDTGAKAKQLLSAFERTLVEIQTRVVDDEDDTHFGCFPFGWRSGNSTCRVYTSLVCVLCRALNEDTRGTNRGRPGR